MEDKNQLISNAEKNYELYRWLNGDEHWRTMDELNNLAYVLKEQHEYDRALPMYEKLLQYKKINLTKTTPKYSPYSSILLKYTR